MSLKAHFLAAFAGLSMGLLVGSLVVAPAFGFGPCPQRGEEECPVQPDRQCMAEPDGTCPDTGLCHQAQPICLCEQASGGGCDCCHHRNQ